MDIWATVMGFCPLGTSLTVLRCVFIATSTPEARKEEGWGSGRELAEQKLTGTAASIPAAAADWVREQGPKERRTQQSPPRDTHR
jgi:hypothetical protein